MPKGVWPLSQASPLQFNSSSVSETVHLISPNPVLKSQRGLRELPVFAGVPMKYILTPVKEWLRNMADVLALRMRSSRQKAKASPFYVLLLELPP